MTDQDQVKLATKIQALLAQAESEAALGHEGARDTFLAKAAALQLKYAIDDSMLRAAGKAGTDELTHGDFCTESNTPLIKAKRQLINGLAIHNRGHAVMMGEYRPKRDGGIKFDRRAKIRVYAHQSDLDFITMLYNSLILQMQTMMANDERLTYLEKAKVAGWRVSYAYGWVARVIGRIAEAARRNESQAESTEPGTALVLRDRSALVEGFVNDRHPNLRRSSYRLDDKSEAGRLAGRNAAENADLGGKKLGGDRRQLEA